MLVLCGRLRVRPLHVSRSTAIPDVRPPVGSDRPTYMRLHYPLLLRATRPPDQRRHPVRHPSMETVINDGHRLTRTDETDRIAL